MERLGIERQGFYRRFMELLMLVESPDCYDSLVSLLLWTKNCRSFLSPSVGAELQLWVKITPSERQRSFRKTDRVDSFRKTVSECELEYPFVGLWVKLTRQAEQRFYFYQG